MNGEPDLTEPISGGRLAYYAGSPYLVSIEWSRGQGRGYNVECAIQVSDIDEFILALQRLKLKAQMMRKPQETP